MLALFKINCRLNICFYSSFRIPVVWLSDTYDFNYVFSFGIVTKGRRIFIRPAKYHILFVENLSWILVCRRKLEVFNYSRCFIHIFLNC